MHHRRLEVVAQIFGSSGNDFLVGTPEADWISGRQGNDTIVAGGGNDTINMSTGGTASHGNDVLEVMARKKITISAAFECFELRGNEDCGCYELYRTAAGKRHGAAGADCERIPTVVEAQDTGL